ncbi:MAG: MFS transporter [Pseudomonadales bacterium]|nr:MFS transporter [Pseudomonadales bacterium]
MNPATPPIPFWLKTAYGFGSVAFGVKNNGFDYFLLLFYSQVVGLDARLVGIAITTALVFDALSDPVVGYWSDNLRSRWGRRHPFMYASLLPVPLSYFLLWNPPTAWGQTGLFWYLLLLAVCIRTFITLYETPSTALTPELTGDYHERSSLLSYRYYFGWTGGNAMTVMMFFAIFPAFATPSIADGRFNPASYEVLGVVGSVLIFISILASTAGTHSRIPYLKSPPPQRTMTLGRIFRELYETLANRSFIALFVGALLGAVATGLAAALAFYFYTYFWEFTSVQTGLITMGVFLAAVLGGVLAPIVTRRFGKKRGAMGVGLIAFLGAPLPVFLRLIDVLPDNGSPFIFWFVLITGIIDVGLIICFQILYSSMTADLVEQAELRTGRRSEGVFFSSVTFVRKSVQGLGLMVASFVLALAEFPTGATVEQVTDETVWRLGAYYVPTILFLWMSMIAVISFYKLSEGEHQDNLEKLRSGAGSG